MLLKVVAHLARNAVVAHHARRGVAGELDFLDETSVRGGVEGVCPLAALVGFAERVGEIDQPLEAVRRTEIQAGGGSGRFDIVE